MPNEQMLQYLEAEGMPSAARAESYLVAEIHKELSFKEKVDSSTSFGIITDNKLLSSILGAFDYQMQEQTNRLAIVITAGYAGDPENNLQGAVGARHILSCYDHLQKTHEHYHTQKKSPHKACSLIHFLKDFFKNIDELFADVDKKNAAIAFDIVKEKVIIVKRMPFKTGLSNYWLCALYLNEDNALSICTGFPITTQRFLEISHGNRRFIPIRPDTNIIESLTTSEEADDLNTNENTKSTDTSYGKITTTLTETKDPSKGPTQDNCTSDYEDKSVSTCEIFLEKPNSKLYHYFKISRNRRLNLQIKLQKIQKPVIKFAEKLDELLNETKTCYHWFSTNKDPIQYTQKYDNLLIKNIQNAMSITEDYNGLYVSFFSSHELSKMDQIILEIANEIKELIDNNFILTLPENNNSPSKTTQALSHDPAIKMIFKIARNFYELFEGKHSRKYLINKMNLISNLTNNITKMHVEMAINLLKKSHSININHPGVDCIRELIREKNPNNIFRQFSPLTAEFDKLDEQQEYEKVMMSMGKIKGGKS